MKTRSLSICSAALALSMLMACNTNENRLTTPAADPDEERYHEKSFSWTETTGPLAKGSTLAAISSKRTSFATADEMLAAVQALEEKLDDKAFTDSVWKPVDYACDELELAVWNEYGTIRVGDSVVFDEGMLRERCEELGVDTAVGPGELGKSAAANPPMNVDDRQYPYKMIGHSWSAENRILYKTTGAETQFKKHRKKFLNTAWWDTDASRIGVKTLYFDCGILRDDNSRYIGRGCIQRATDQDWDSNDDYVSERRISTGIQFGFQNYNGSLFLQPGMTRPIPLEMFAGALGLHSVNHAGLQFRATSSSGLGEINIRTEVPAYVTW